MGNICLCDDALSSQLNEFGDKNQDPRIYELSQHLKIMEQKLISNLSSIEDFKLLLSETKREPVTDPFKDIVNMIDAIESGFEDSKSTLKVVQNKKNKLRKTLESTEQQMSLLSKKKQQPNSLMDESANTQPQRPELDTEAENLTTIESAIRLNSNEEQIAEVHAQINSMYKKISDLLKMLRQGEEEAQIQMLKWENFVIQHEKMQKLREEIQESFNSIKGKLNLVGDQLQNILGLQGFFHKIISIIETCQQEAIAGLSKSQSLTHQQTAQAFCDQQQSHLNELDGSVGLASLSEIVSSASKAQRNATMLKRANSARSEDGPLINTDILDSFYEYDEGQSMIDSSDQLKYQIDSLTQQIPLLQSNYVNKKTKMEQFQVTFDKIVSTTMSTDIYELDSFLKQLQDFLNNLEINLRKLNQMHGQLDQKKYNVPLLDYCENLFNQTQEMQLSQHRLQRIMQYWLKLKTNLQASAESNKYSQTGQSHSQVFYNQICDKEIALLQRESTKIQQCLDQLAELQIMNVSLGDLNQIESLMRSLSSADQKSREVDNLVFESNQSYQSVNILSGSLGQQIQVDQLTQSNKLILQKIARCINDSINRLQNQVLDAQRIQSESRLDETTNAYDGISMSIHRLLQQYKQLKDQTNDTQAQIVAWQQSASQQQKVSVLENIDEEDQDQHVVEIINIHIQIVKLIYVLEKLDVRNNKIDRALQKTNLNLKITQTTFQKQSVDSQIDTAKQLNQKVNEKISKAIRQLKNRIDQFKKTASKKAPSSSQEEYQIDSLQNYESQVTNIAVQLESYSIQSQEIQDSLEDLTAQMQEKLQKSAPQYFTIFHTSIVERDPNIATQVSSSEQFDQNMMLQSYSDQIQKQQTNNKQLGLKIKDIQTQLQQILGFVQRQTKLSGVTGSQKDFQTTPNNSSMVKSLNNTLEHSADQVMNQSKLSQTSNNNLDTSVQAIFNAGNCHFYEQQSFTTDGQKYDQDDIDRAISQCQEDQTVLKNLNIEKVNTGEYRVEQKLYKFRLLQGNNLAIRMFAGYIYADCLVHFDEELMSIVKKSI